MKKRIILMVFLVTIAVVVAGQTTTRNFVFSIKGTELIRFLCVSDTNCLEEDLMGDASQWTNFNVCLGAGDTKVCWSILAGKPR